MTDPTKKDNRKGAPIVLPANSPDLIFLNRNNKNLILLEEGETVKLQTVSPFGIQVGGVGGGGDQEDPDEPTDPTIDKPDLSDIESITYEQYFDTFNSLRYNAIIKIRNSSKKKDQVIAVDARNTPKGETENTSGTGGDPVGFIAPSPTTPSVVFDRTGTAIAWGWNNSTSLGSYTSVSYEWEIRSGSSVTSTKISSGTKPYAASGSFAIGNSGKNRTYRVSSGQGDTPATSSPRWLRVRAVVVGTNGKKYYSAYSKPI